MAVGLWDFFWLSDYGTRDGALVIKFDLFELFDVGDVCSSEC